MVTRPALPAAALCLFFAFCGFAKTPPKASGKKPATANRVSATKAKAASRSATRHRVSPQSRAKTRSAARNVRYTRRYAAPVSPASDRIRLVQQALIERGHLTGEPTGIWDSASVDALKKFESANNVRPDGKLDSKMLILLGLGPKYQAELNLPGDAASVAAEDDKQEFQRLNN